MKTDQARQQITQLTEWFISHQPCTIATSGGIDSMLLAFIAHQAIGEQARIIHSTSAAVPSADAQRITSYANRYHWNLTLITSDEINNPDYKNNPVNRCYYCKSCLFTRMTALQSGPIVTGTNLDDLGDYRPGLIAARENNVYQPYVELSITKQHIRQIADHLSLDDLKDLPASPCLASRIETGIAIDQHELSLVDRVENMVKATLQTDIVRFRIGHTHNEIQLNPQLCQTLPDQQKEALVARISTVLTAKLSERPIRVTDYRQGSAFIGIKNIKV